MARYAHYYYIAYQPKILLANLIFVSELEKSLWQNIKEKEKIASVLFHIFKLTDDELLDLDFSSIEEKEIIGLLEKIKNPSTSKIFKNLKKSKIYCHSHFVRLPYLNKNLAYNILKSETKRIKELEEKISNELKQTIKIYFGIPKALTTRTRVSDKGLNAKYGPSLIYDYSPVVRSLEQKMYFDRVILISSVESVSKSLTKLLRNVSSQKTDFDMYTYAIYNYIEEVKKSPSNEIQKWNLKRVPIYNFLKNFYDFFHEKGDIEKKIEININWYCEDFYEILQKLEFLDFISEDFNIAISGGFIPCYAYSKGEYAEELLKSLGLTKEEKHEIEEFVKQYFESEIIL